MRLVLPFLLSASLLQACTMMVPQPVPQPIPQTDLSSCFAVGLEGLIGAPARLLPVNGAWSSLRVIRPGQMVTMDFIPTRLNVRVDANDNILSLSCG